jgi:hypothetical protein
MEYGKYRRLVYEGIEKVGNENFFPNVPSLYVPRCAHEKL